jgi:hypothetical protein
MTSLATSRTSLGADAESAYAETATVFRLAHHLLVRETPRLVVLVCSCGHWGPVVVAAKLYSTGWDSRMDLDEAEWAHFAHKIGWSLR